MNTLTGRHALVTGGNRGIGAAIAGVLAADGARVTLLVRDGSSGELAGARMPGTVGIVTADVTDEEAVKYACAAAVARDGPVHFLVNNAGFAESAPFARSDTALFIRMLAVHLYGPLYCTQALLPGMIEMRFGRIVNIASTAGVSGHAYVTAYSAAKHALVGLTRSLSKEVIAKGVTVNAVCPGYTDTDLVARSVETITKRTGRTAADATAALLADSPLQRFIAPSEVAAAVRWLCDDLAASVTGQAIIVDGGELA